MKTKDDSAPSAAQITAWRCLWSLLLTPHTSSDERINEGQKTETAESGEDELMGKTDTEKEVA